ALRKRLEDPVRSVRIAAASTLRANLDQASPAAREYLHYLDNNADHPSGQLQKGMYFLARNEPASALPHLQKAIAWDPHSPPFRQELAVAYSLLDRPQDAVDTLKEACRLAPEDADCHYQLGLAYNEIRDLKNAAAELEKAVRLDSHHVRAWYNLGLAQSALGREEEAIESLLRAEAGDPGDARIPYARATILARLGRKQEALQAAKLALQLNPSLVEAGRLVEVIRR
ncbi:MAG TPA: tetratricopeptide repeat protein, partial [Clostridia bacterium]|nr:tetratricopeptide repeat protein [Clostridia bacterium]